MDTKQYYWIECFIDDHDDKTRELTASEYGGYTELDGRIFAVADDSSKKDRAFGIPSGILFAYTYDKNGAELGLTSGQVITTLFDELKFDNISLKKVKGGYYQAGQLIKEDGLILLLPQLSDVQLGAIAQRIKDIFRQESVIVTTTRHEVYFIND